MTMGTKAKKGGHFEREISKALSLWWSAGERDDLYWRTQASGGRATIRRKAGKGTSGQYGDIQAVEEYGAELCKVFAIECKCGYFGDTFADCMDKPGHLKQSTFEGFVEQAINQTVEAPYWLLIFKRDRRDTMVFYPLSFLKHYLVTAPAALGNVQQDLKPSLVMHAVIRTKADKANFIKVSMVGMPWDVFLKHKPDIIREICSHQ